MPRDSIRKRFSSFLNFPEKLPSIKEATRLLIEEALERTLRNQSHAAKLLGISQQALSKRIKSWNGDT